MAKKEATPAQIEARRKFAEQAKARAAAKKAQTNTEITEDMKLTDAQLTAGATEAANPDPVNHGQPNPQDYADLQSQVNELKGYLFDILRTGTAGAAPAGVAATNQGLVGTREKYILDPAHYPDPRERLAQEPKLARFAFDMNYELEFNVGVSQYQTKDGVNTKEPKFTIQLNRVVIDEETGEPTDGRYVITQGIFHEDPEAAIVVASEQGIDVNAWEEKPFLDEMRYLRFRDWLLEAFYTPLPARDRKNKREVVINGKLVQYFEVNSQGGVGMKKADWDEAPRIKF